MKSNPSQAITSGPWNWGNEYAEINEFKLNNSDIISFHIYANSEETRNALKNSEN